MVPSFSRKGCPYDNACIESFHAILKKEEVYLTKYEALRQRELRYFKINNLNSYRVESIKFYKVIFIVINMINVCGKI
jgi:transposase InsO family protein